MCACVFRHPWAARFQALFLDSKVGAKLETNDHFLGCEPFSGVKTVAGPASHCETHSDIQEHTHVPQSVGLHKLAVN